MISGAIMLIPNRIFYKISGKDAKKFLQGITTNDMNELKPKMFSPAALLNSKGRLIAPFHVYCIDDMKEDSVFLAEIHKYFNKIFSSHLTKHKLRAKVHIEPCDHHSVYLDRNNYDDVKIGEVFRDSSNFVSRIISRNLNNESNSQDITKVYDRYRYLNGLAEGPVTEGLCQLFELEYHKTYLRLIEGMLPFDINLDMLGYINFGKGCYIGQELMARTKFKGVVRKRLLPFFFSDAFPEASLKVSTHFGHLSEETEKILEGQPFVRPSFAYAKGQKISILPSKSVVGDVIEADSELGFGLALLRLDEIRKVCDKEAKMVIDTTSDCINTFRPRWWSEEL